MTDSYPLPAGIWSSDGRLRGRPTGATRACQLDGCRGISIVVRWPDGKITYPCTKGLVERPDGEMQIG